jgi:hypothetical protein
MRRARLLLFRSSAEKRERVAAPGRPPLIATVVLSNYVTRDACVRTAAPDVDRGNRAGDNDQGKSGSARGAGGSRRYETSSCSVTLAENTRFRPSHLAL